MKLNLSFFQPIVKKTVSAVSTVSPATDEGSGHNRDNNSAVSPVIKNSAEPKNLTDLTGEKNERLCVKPADDAALTDITDLTAKNTMPVFYSGSGATGGGLLSADAVELISRGAELEYYAKQQGAKFAAYELARLLAAVDIARDRSALDMACRELAAFIDTGAIQKQF